MSDWNDDRIELLRKYHEERLAFSLIADRINAETGSTFSRNACIGKAVRIGLQSRPKAPGPHVERMKHKREQPRTIRPKPRERLSFSDSLAPDLDTLKEIDAMPPPSGFLAIAFLDLKPSHCRYPRGGTDGAPILFCGQPKIDGSSYCAACHRRCHAGTTRRFVSDEERAKRSASARRRFQRERRAA